MAAMKVTLFACGVAANESELLALNHLSTRLKSMAGEGTWLLLTNVAFSVTNQLQSDEIDIVAIGPCGVRVVEVKHWSMAWMDSHPDLVVEEAERVTNKARKIGSTLRKLARELPRVDGSILLTQDPSKVKKISGKFVRGVRLCSLTEWQEAIGLTPDRVLSDARIAMLGRALEPKAPGVMDGSIRRLAGYVNLELQTPKEERFRRAYKGIHSTRQDRVVLHLYDISASDDKNAEEKARREFDALQRLQLHAWAPRILDSYQDAPGYQGELFFFTLIDPAAPSINERSSDSSWDPIARLAFARSTVSALMELHSAKTAHEAMLHRDLTPATILVRYDNSPILTGFERAKISSDASVASASFVSGQFDDYFAPEVRKLGSAIADQRSDVFSLCACLIRLFDGAGDEISAKARNLLTGGLAENPSERLGLDQLDARLSEQLGQSPPPVEVPPARFWTEDQIVRFRDSDYRIVSRLGTGGIGMTFKVTQIDRSTKEDLGTFVAKVGHTEQGGRRVLRAYNMARSHLGRHPALSAIFEIAREWEQNRVLALMTWIEGTPLRDFIGVFPLLAEEHQEVSFEALALRWIRLVCAGLDVLHRNNLIHGDVSPRNLIVSGGDLVLTDYDFVQKIGEPVKNPATVLYCSPSYENQSEARPSDDLYALAASFFHVVFEREPFLYDGVPKKSQGLNWDGIDRAGSPTLVRFLDTATHPDRSRRFSSVAECLDSLRSPSEISSGAPVVPDVANVGRPVEPVPVQGAQQNLSPQRIVWLRSVLQSYPGSTCGNQETRGLDSDFAAQTYVPTNLEESVYRDVLERRIKLVILCGNAGDGKTALLQHLAERFGLGGHTSAERTLVGKTADGLEIKINLDGSAAWKGRSADELLDEFFEPFQNGSPGKDIAHLLAINDGRLLEWVVSRSSGRETALTEELYELLEGQHTSGSHIRFISLNERSLVGGINYGLNNIETDFLDKLVDHLYGGEQAASIWTPCQTCTAKGRCAIFRATRVFSPALMDGAVTDEVRERARHRLFEALQAVHLRGETHVSMRELRASLVYILFGTNYCDDYHLDSAVQPPPYWDLAFAADSPGRQGEVLRELALFDPAVEAHPHIDRYLLSKPVTDLSKTAPQYPELILESARRKAYFEWTETDLEQVSSDRHALDLARGRHLREFRNLPLNADTSELCARICAGISRLEDLPKQALDRPGVVPLRITPRTPTETAFWVEKPISSFSLRAELPSAADGVDRLHRSASLIYRYRNGTTEILYMGAELFHLLLELSDGYQLGDVSTDDAFAQLSIFVQRLAREDEREILAWNPMQDDDIFRLAAAIEPTETGPQQRMQLTRVAGDSL
jgi:serine/threonine protein kinase